jgi:hypothetical protein
MAHVGTAIVVHATSKQRRHPPHAGTRPAGIDRHERRHVGLEARSLGVSTNGSSSEDAANGVEPMVHGRRMERTRWHPGSFAELFVGRSRDHASDVQLDQRREKIKTVEILAQAHLGQQKHQTQQILSSRSGTGKMMLRGGGFGTVVTY